MNIWKPKKGDIDLEVSVEKNKHDAIHYCNLLSKESSGTYTKDLSKLLQKFLLLANSSIACKVTGKYMNRGVGYGLEIPVKYDLNG